MRYKLLGKSGLRVSELALGTMTFGEDWGWGASKEESQKMFDAFVAAGGNFIDTSNNYTDGTSERYVGEFIASAREPFVVATKYTLSTRKDDSNGGGNSRKNMVQAVEASLKRLNTDYLDLYWLHMWDFTTPVEEVMRAFDDLVRAGKVLYVGFSDTPSWIISQAVTVAELRGWTRPVAVQLPYSLDGRTPEHDMLPMAQHLDMAVTPWGLLGGGTLTGKYNAAGDEPKRYDGAGDSAKELAQVLMAMAADIDRTPSQIAINWVRQQQAKAQIIPILGARTLAQLEDNLRCLEFELTEEQLAQLNEASPLSKSFPHDFLSRDFIKDLIFGETYSLVDNHRA